MRRTARLRRSACTAFPYEGIARRAEERGAQQPGQRPGGEVGGGRDEGARDAGPGAGATGEGKVRGDGAHLLGPARRVGDAQPHGDGLGPGRAEAAFGHRNCVRRAGAPVHDGEGDDTADAGQPVVPGEAVEAGLGGRAPPRRARPVRAHGRAPGPRGRRARPPSPGCPRERGLPRGAGHDARGRPSRAARAGARPGCR